jgi:hypothetical protein
MAAPVVSARVLPSAPFMKEGFRTQISFYGLPNFCLWEIDLKPPDSDGQEPIDTTTQFNSGGVIGVVAYPPLRTYYPRAVAKLGPIEGVFAYPSKAYEDHFLLLNIIGSCTLHFPDLNQLTVWAHLQSFKPEVLKEGDFPKANCVIWIDNWDPTNNVQAGPVWTPNTGT